MITKGLVTIPTDLDVVDETLNIIEKWKGDALRDCDGTTFPDKLKNIDGKVYATYYTTRKDNEWAKNNLDEVQQMYIMTDRYLALDESLKICLMDHLYPDMLKVNDDEDIYRWWEVIDRTTQTVLSKALWVYDPDSGEVIIKNPTPFHEYTVSFLAYIMWDPVHMYNSLVNDWKDVEHQITFDVRQPKTQAYSLERLRKFLREKPYVDVVRFTTFFHQFTLIFDDLAREKYVDWYGYSASVSPYILKQFEEEVGYSFRPEYIIDEGYYQNSYRFRTKEFKDFQAFQRREVAKLAKKFVDICHEENREAMMFLGDHWIGTEPFMDEFKSIGLDALVGSVGNGQTLRLISDVEGVKYREGRFLPYFFPDTFNEEGNPVKEARENWIVARRAILRKPIDRIGYGGYLKLAIEAPGFVDCISEIADEFRLIQSNIDQTAPYTVATVAVLTADGHMRKWGAHMVHHAIYHKENYAYYGVIECLSGAPYDVRFISYDDIISNESALDDIDVIINCGDANTSYSGGDYWKNELLLSRVRKFIHSGKGFIGVGEPTAVQFGGQYIQLSKALGVEFESGFTLNKDKYNHGLVSDHFITKDLDVKNFGRPKLNMYAFEDTDILAKTDEGDILLASNSYGLGRTVYFSGLPYSFCNNRLLHRAITYAISKENLLEKWYSSNYNVDVHYYPETGKYCVVNNTDLDQDTIIYLENSHMELKMKASEIKWFEVS